MSVSSVATKYEARAPPRRRVKKDESEDQPIFLRKAYAMITSCPSEIGGWSDKGDTVIIKDVKAFSEKVIPTAYKHKNFSSFVRQLNFYGFRKVKSASLQNPNWWEFRHANFIRGKPDLMSEIKRSMHFVPDSFGGSKEISDLKMQVATLTERLNFLNDQVEKLTGNFGGMGMKTEKNKKRKISATESTNQPIELRRMNSLGSNYADEMKSSGLPVPVGEELENFDWEEMAVDEEEDSPQPGDEEEFFELVGDLAEMEEANKTVMEKETPAPIIQSIPAESVADTSFSEVSSVIDKLPSDLQLRFVDKLAEVVGLQLSAAMNSQKLPIVKAEPYPDAQPVHPVSSYPAYVLPSGSKAPEIALPLASAAISAFLMSHLRSIPASQGVSSVPVAEQLGAK